MRRLFVLLAALLITTPLFAVSTDAVDCDGTDDLGTFSSLSSHWRTQIGSDMVIAYFVNVDIADGGAHMVTKRSDTDAAGTYLGANVDPDFCIGYQGSDQVCTGGTPASVDTWYGNVAWYDDDTDQWTLWSYLNGGTHFDTETFSGTMEGSDDSTNQEISICGVEDGGVIVGDANMLSNFWTFIRQAEITFTITDAVNFVTDPINTQNAWLATYGTGVRLMFNEARVDISGNGETISFSGNAAWGTGNGPNVPAETGTGSLLLRRHRD